MHIARGYLYAFHGKSGPHRTRVLSCMIDKTHVTVTMAPWLDNPPSPPGKTLLRMAQVVCINISKRENGINEALTKAAGLDDKVSIPGPKSFFDTGT